MKKLTLTSKTTLALDLLEQEMEVLSREQLVIFKGGGSEGSGDYGLFPNEQYGGGNNGQPTTGGTGYGPGIGPGTGNGSTSTPEKHYEWAADPSLNVYYREVGSDTWIAYKPLDTVTITPDHTNPANNPYGYPPAINWGSYNPNAGGSGGGSGTTDYLSNPNAPVPTSHMTSNNDLVRFMTEAENFVDFADDDGAGNLTIGFGHKLTEYDKNTHRFDNRVITRDEANKLFLEDLSTAISSVQRNIHVQLNQQQFDALVSFAFHQGSTNFANSDVNTLVNQGKFTEAADALRHYSDNNPDSDKTKRGKQKRHGQEADLFESGDYVFNH